MRGPGYLDVAEVGKDFAGLRALSDVSLRCGQDEILGVIGPNGSGKTTLLNVISGVIRPSAGRVRLGEQVVSSRPSYRVANAGIARTFQNIRLVGEWTVLENVEVAASHSPRARGWLRARRESADAISLVGLSDHSHRQVAELSYGSRRRVELARAIATRPYFVLLDEPAAGLNEAESDGVLELIRDIARKRECGVIVVEHDMRLIMRLAHRIHVLNEGQTLAVGEPAQVQRDPAVIEAYLGSQDDGSY